MLGEVYTTMERYIIIRNQDLSIIDRGDSYLINEIAECDDDDYLVVFKTFDEAVSYQEKNGVSGKIVELPLW